MTRLWLSTRKLVDVHNRLCCRRRLTLKCTSTTSRISCNSIFKTQLSAAHSLFNFCGMFDAAKIFPLWFPLQSQVILLSSVAWLGFLKLGADQKILCSQLLMLLICSCIWSGNFIDLIEGQEMANVVTTKKLFDCDFQYFWPPNIHCRIYVNLPHCEGGEGQYETCWAALNIRIFLSSYLS